MEAKSDLIFVVLIIVALGFMWVFTGGPERARNQGVFIKPPAPLNTGETYGKINSNGLNVKTNTSGGTTARATARATDTDDAKKVGANTTSSEFENKISIKNSSIGPKKTSALEEYITLSASSRNNKKVSITGWILESMVSKKQVTIGVATEVYISGLVNTESDISLAPGESVTISTGDSPIGVSFKVNKCSGYHEQFQDFFPGLSKKCPYPKNEFDDVALSIPATDNVCEDFVDDISRCEMELEAFPAGVSNQCTEFVSNTLNYTGCVKNHRNDLDFFTKEWRVFLGKNEELWRAKRETIRLIDNEGKVVDTYTY